MYNFIIKLFKEKAIIKSLIINELKTRYLGSYLGILWAFINPLITVGVLWLVFSMGFKSRPVDNFPFLIWLLSGMVPWFFLSEAIISSTTSILEKSFLVKKIVFDVTLLPFVKIGAAVLVHSIFIFILFISFISYGYQPKFVWLQLLYYLFSGVILVQALSWLTSSIVIFIKDLGQIVNIVIQFGFWLTPVFWTHNSIPEKYHWIIKLNPLFYIVNGYRETMVDEIVFWSHPLLTLYFWSFTLTLFVIGKKVFERLRPHFADVI